MELALNEQYLLEIISSEDYANPIDEGDVITNLIPLGNIQELVL